MLPQVVVAVADFTHRAGVEWGEIASRVSRRWSRRCEGSACCAAAADDIGVATVPLLLPLLRSGHLPALPVSLCCCCCCCAQTHSCLHGNLSAEEPHSLAAIMTHTPCG